MANVGLQFQASAGDADPQSRPLLLLGQLHHLHRVPWSHIRGKLQPRVTEEVSGPRQAAEARSRAAQAGGGGRVQAPPRRPARSARALACTGPRRRRAARAAAPCGPCLPETSGPLPTCLAVGVAQGPCLPAPPWGPVAGGPCNPRRSRACSWAAAPRRLGALMVSFPHPGGRAPADTPTGLGFALPTAALPLPGRRCFTALCVSLFLLPHPALAGCPGHTQPQPHGQLRPVPELCHSGRPTPEGEPAQQPLGCPLRHAAGAHLPAAWSPAVHLGECCGHRRQSRPCTRGPHLCLAHGTAESEAGDCPHPRSGSTTSLPEL